MSHTKEPWKVDTFAGCDHADIRDTNGRRIAVVAGTYPMDIKTEDANAQRIVACVNACAGMDDPAKVIAAKEARIAELESGMELIAKETAILLENLQELKAAALERGDLGGTV